MERAPRAREGVVRARRGRALVVGFALAAGLACSPAGTLLPPPDADLAVLFVGNSLTYSNDLPAIVENLLTTYGTVGTVHVESIAFANFGLQDHWSEGSARARIEAGGWDVVVVQQGPSATEGRPSLIEYAGRFAQLAEAGGGRLAVYMVWPSTARFFDFDGVSESHRLAAEGADGLLLPAGDAWRAAWAVDPDLALYGPDGFHPSLMGSYLAALVMAQRLGGVDLADLPDGMIVPGGVIALPEGVSDLLKDAATEANASVGP